MKRHLRVEQLEARLCFSTGSTLAPVGTGPGYTLSINDTGRVATMQVTQAEFLAYTAGTQTVAQERALTKRIYAALPDVFDQIIVVNNLTRFEPLDTAPYFGVHTTVQNDIRGIGDVIFNDAALYGSAGKLQSFVQVTDRAGMRDGVVLHEVFHRWGNKLIFDLPKLFAKQEMVSNGK